MLAMEVNSRLMKNLPSGILIGMDYLGPQGEQIDLGNRCMTFPRMDKATTPINVRPRVKHNLASSKAKAAKLVVIQPRSQAKISFTTASPHPEEYDVELVPTTHRSHPATVPAIIVSNQTTHLIACNYTDKHITVRKGMKLGVFDPCQIEGLYAVHPEDVRPEERIKNKPSVIGSNPFKTVTASGIVIYGDKDKSGSEIPAMESVALKYCDLWSRKRGIINIPTELGMRLPLKP
ncbi:hypothetical protein BDU57DRAFT_113945 [Ampelomyces quisqualis]|uniref:Uncharacterized protein n=1 Tax=Ampelomyces quisqualis TaxID=50730 RepID=A0A6A5Q617_AMPQU|nr:hypothetical protein BDU57DRAFT_113945 [Ampelomyces quisqualis]